MPKENIVKYKGERRDLAFKVLPGPQTLAMRSDVDVLEFGGARGGSKTHTLIYKAQVRMHKEGFKGLIARRTYKQLGDIMQRCQELYPKLGYQWEAAPEKHWWINPKTGSFIKLLSFQHEKNVDDVLGHEYQFIGIDQAEGFTQKMLEKLRMCTRTTNPDIPPRAFYTTNPGGVSHLYHKREFVDACQPIPDGMKKYNERYEVYWQPMRPGPVRKDKYGVLRHYIPALVFENPYLLENDPIYVGTLLSMPEPLRSAMLYGDWSVYEGMFFGEWNKQIHVVPGFPIPLTWPRYVSVDYGTKHPFVLLWHAIDPSDGCVYTYREYVQPDKALRFHATMFHALNNQEEIDRVICPHDMWMRIDRDPESTAIQERIVDRWAKYLGAKFTCSLAPAGAGTRKLAADKMRDMLYWSNTMPPQWFIFACCKNLIETMPAMQADEIRTDELMKMDGDDTVDAAMKFWLYYRKPEFPFKPVLTKGVGEWKKGQQYPVVQQKQNVAHSEGWMVG